MAFRFVYWIILLSSSSGVLHARTTGNQPRDSSGSDLNGIIQKTSFTCRGKESGYYADIETDCQVYHLCNEQGRKFTYECPNTTLFHQRMLICDHWYMVDCSTSEANYEFNRLIGQRDKHFVSDSAAEKRTPRPDVNFNDPFPSSILYKTESSKKNDFLASQNAIKELELSRKESNKKQFEILETQASSNILPPQIDLNSIDPTLLPASEEFPHVDKSNERRNTQSGESYESIAKNYRPPPTGFEPPRLLPSHNQEFRQREEMRLKNLGLPLQNPTQATKYTQKSTAPVQSTKKPVRTFDPDKNFKAFDHFFPSKKATHKDYDFSQYFTRKNTAVTTPSPARRQLSANNNIANKNQLPSGPNATNRPFVNNHFNQQKSPTTAAPQTTRKPVTTTPRTTARTSPTVQSPTAKKTPLVTRSPSYYQPQARSNQQQPQVPINQNQITAAPSSQPKTTQQQLTQGHKKIISAPANDLLPPHELIKHYDDATTRGPPIYYEWRVPDEGLLPPKFDNETDTNSLKRSITEEGNFDNDFQSSETRRYSGGGNSIKIQYKDLQKLFAIPDVEFNLESNGREGYDNAEAVNSFQVKIPYRKDVTGKSSVDRYYYLEHGHCNPECHPYFFKPGRCEPCIKLKKK